jgi:formate/nitrite transporter FocA (FNT family)
LTLYRDRSKANAAALELPNPGVAIDHHPPQPAETQEEPENIPSLNERQLEEAERRTSVPASVVHEAIRKDGEEELRRPVSALAWSGLAAGLAMGFSFVVQSLLYHYVPDAPWKPLIASLGYPVGFLIVIIGRQQLYTENTLTAIIPLLARRNVTTLVHVLRLWAVVFAANIAGAHAFAWVVADTAVLKPEIHQAMKAVALKAADVNFGDALLRGIFAGWLIAMVVWMIAASDTGRIWIIVILTYIVNLAAFTHVIAGSIEVLYLVATGVKSWWSFCGGYLIPSLIGNTLGGVALVSALNHAQVIAGMQAQKEEPRRR